MKSLELKKLILIGASTGGPAHIEKILSSLVGLHDTAIIIAQHMGADFLPSFVKRLREKSKQNILLAQDKELIFANAVYIVTNNCEFEATSQGIRFHITTKQNAHFNPDINELFFSALPLIGQYTLLPILLTGIGDDGVDGCSALAQKGVQCIAESQKSAIVYGIPARAKERVQDVQVKDLDEIISLIHTFGASYV
ncbi:MAG: chemotaxis protein CheB [Helicobacteraceae bacterium]|nr:chemotaxis protein CheB [Helicobacteraceae bacterium]